ncbi:MAG: hypothetical protein J5778_05955 [Clostridiales bacterium]|nr:hypothetical protein [Clostridiales bacterium]
MALRDDWKNTGKDLGNAFANLGKTLVKSGADVAHKADNLVNGDDKAKETEKAAEAAAETATEAAAEAVAEETKTEEN